MVLGIHPLVPKNHLQHFLQILAQVLAVAVLAHAGAMTYAPNMVIAVQMFVISVELIVDLMITLMMALVIQVLAQVPAVAVLAHAGVMMNAPNMVIAVQMFVISVELIVDLMIALMMALVMILPTIPGVVSITHIPQ
mmetsp:Transcript_6027/g.9129  ORF Transcript_6027/g.9129 Transcript_6027/m.9129 type:complete len:137 (+) Transcript_6027:350-760(+)